MKKALRFAPLLMLAATVSLLAACSTKREAFDKALVAGKLEKAGEISRAGIEKSSPNDSLEWLLLAADSAHLAGQLDEASATYTRACDLFRQRDSEKDALARDPARFDAALLENPVNAPYAANTAERIFAATRLGETWLERRDLRQARKAFADAAFFQKNAQKRLPAEAAACSRAFDALLKRYAPAVGTPAPYFAATHFSEQNVNDPAFKAYGDLDNPYATYLGAIAALLDGDAAAAESGLKTVAAMLQSNRQVIAEANWFGPAPKHPDVTNRVWVIIENGVQPRLREVRVQSRQKLPTAAAVVSAKLQFALPVLALNESRHTGFRANLSGREDPLYSEVLANIDAIARAEYNRTLPLLEKRETVRALIRATGENSDTKNLPAIPPPAADTRQWSTLPKDIHLLTFNMPANRSFSLSSTHGSRAINVTLPPCKNAIVLFRVADQLSAAPPPRIITFD